MPSSTRWVAELLDHPPQRQLRRVIAPRWPSVAPALALQQLVGEAGQRDRHAQEQRGRDDVRREVERPVLDRLGAGAARSTGPSTLIRATSFCRLTMSFISGGTTRRTAWGSTTSRIVWPVDRPSDRAAARWRLVHALDAGAEHLGDVGRIRHDQRRPLPR